MNILEISKLEKTYVNGPHALKGIDLNITKGDFFALLGPNGAGKSTAIGILSSLIKKTSGKVAMFGLDFDSHTSEIKSRLGIVPQELNFSLFEAPLDILLNQAGYYGIKRRVAMERAKKYLSQLGLWDKRHDNSRTLSGGMKRRLMIARALIHEPEMLILDEPTAGVDVELRRSMWTFLKEINAHGTTIILTTHYLEEAESLCKHIAIIDKGKIIEHSSMKQLLGKLHTETFVLDLSRPLATLPAAQAFRLRLIDPVTIEVDLDKQQNVNDLFVLLTNKQIQVNSMRNKSNRLEQLFINLLGDNNAATQ